MLEVYHKEQPQKFPFPIRALQWYFKNLASIFPGLSVQVLWSVFTRPGKRKIQTRHTGFLDTAERTNLDNHGKNMAAYTWKGTGKSILILHGWKGMSADFRGLIKALIKEEFHIVAVDLPGHGTSEGKTASMPVFMDAIKSIVEEFGPFDTILGHSLGAASSLYATPSLVEELKPEKFVLIGLQTRPIVFFEQIRDVFFVPQNVYDRFLAYGSKVVKRDIEEFKISHIEEHLSGIKAFIIIDEEDEVVDRADQKVLNDIWPDLEFYGGSHGGHYKNYRHPIVIDKIVDFVNR